MIIGKYNNEKRLAWTQQECQLNATSIIQLITL